MDSALVARAPTPAPALLASGGAPPSAEPSHTVLRLSELLGAFSHALDLTEGQPPGHGLRSAWIGDRIGQALRLDPDTRGDLFHAVLLKDLGCSSTAARICELFVTDDLAFKRDMRLVDFDSPRESLPFFLRQAGSTGGVGARLLAWRRMTTDGRDAGRELTAIRCERGADIAQLLRFPAVVSAGIRSLDERWDGRGRPTGLAGDAIPLFSRIAHVAQTVEVFAAARGPEAAMAMLRQRRGRWFDPALVDIVLTLGRDRSFWDRLRSPDLEDEIHATAQGGAERLVDDDYLDDIAAAFGLVVDAKSPYTGGHSVRVGGMATAIGARLGLSPGHVRWLRRGALLHDIGKLGVSNAILDKAGPLTAGEWETMRRHAAWTEDVLGRIAAFRVLSRVAGAHHERLDGNGYPRGLDGRHLRLETRIITVADVFDALTADRPYRAAMGVDEAMAVLERGIGTAFDGACVEALRASLASGSGRIGG